MKIEVIALRRYENSKLKAFVDVLFDDSYVVKGFRIVDSDKGLFVGMPQQMGRNGKWYDIFQPINEEIRQKLCETILACYAE